MRLRHIATAMYSHEIAVWSTASWMRVDGELSAGGRYLDAPPMANSAINGAADGRIYLWSVFAQLPVATISVHSDGNCLASGSNDQTVCFTFDVNLAVARAWHRRIYSPSPELLSQAHS